MVNRNNKSMIVLEEYTEPKAWQMKRTRFALDSANATRSRFSLGENSNTDLEDASHRIASQIYFESNQKSTIKINITKHKRKKHTHIKYKFIFFSLSLDLTWMRTYCVLFLWSCQFTDFYYFGIAFLRVFTIVQLSIKCTKNAARL